MDSKDGVAQILELDMLKELQHVKKKLSRIETRMTTGM